MKLSKNALITGFSSIYSPSQIILYDGVQPSMANYITDFTSKYNSTTGTNTLQVYSNISNLFLISSELSNGVSLIKRSGSQQNYPKQSIRSGTATWAVFYYSPVYQPPSISEKFIIVPVSELAGLGILKLRTTTITYSTSVSDNLMADCIIDITL
jgi:hypothetical protein